METLLFDILVALAMGLIGAIVFSAIGLVSGTDETTTIAPLTLLVILLGVPPVGVFTFFLSAAVSKHMTHAIPTALLGIPGDTMAIPLLQQATFLRNLGVAHIALRKMISGAIVAAFVAVPLAVLFADLSPHPKVHHSSCSVDLCGCGFGNRLFLRRKMGLRLHIDTVCSSHCRGPGSDRQIWCQA